MSMYLSSYCQDCGKILFSQEDLICNNCKKRRKLKEEKKEEILNFLCNMNEDEQKAFKIFIKKIGEEYKKEHTKGKTKN